MHDWWRSAVIYQIYPRSFCDHNGDGVGDLAGITGKMDYLASLGVDAVWISPFFKSPMKDFGYDISDYEAVDRLFGSMDDFRKLMRQAHERGIKIIVDLVLNHSSDEHAWFEESRQDRTNDKADWYVWADPKSDGTPPNNWLSIFGGPAWTWEPRRKQYYFHQFLAEQPDLNLRNPTVQDALLDVIRFWLNEGVDGIRLDACNAFIHDGELRNNPPRSGFIEGGGVWAANPYGMQWHHYDKSQPENLLFIERIRKLLDEYDTVMSVAEIGDDNGVELSTAYVAGDKRLHTAYSFSFLGQEFSARHLRDTVKEFASYPGNGWPAWAFSNHDSVRAQTRWGGENASGEFAKLLLALLCCLRGTVFLYQGEELGLPEAYVPHEAMLDPYGIKFFPAFRGRDGARTPMPWTESGTYCDFSDAQPFLPIPMNHRPLAVSNQEGDPDSVLNFARKFLSWRKTAPAVLIGEITFHDTPEPFLVFEREYEGQKLLCAFNLSAESARLDFENAEMLTPVDGHDISGGATLAGKQIALPAHGFLIAEIAG